MGWGAHADVVLRHHVGEPVLFRLALVGGDDLQSTPHPPGRLQMRPEVCFGVKAEAKREEAAMIF